MADVRLFLPALAGARAKAVEATAALLADVPEARDPLTSGQPMNPTLSEVLEHLRLDGPVAAEIGPEAVASALALVVAEQGRRIAELEARLPATPKGKAGR